MSANQHTAPGRQSPHRTDQRPICPQIDPLRFDRADTIITGVVMLLASLGGLWAGVVSPALAWATGRPFTRTIDAPDGAALRSNPGSDAVAESAAATIPSPDAPLWIARLIEGGLHAALLVAILWLLWGIIRSVTHGRAFDRANVARLRWLAGLLILGAALCGSVSGVVSGMTQNAVFVHPGTTVMFEASFHWHLLAIGAGLLSACLAEAFRRGARLEDDVEGLV